MYIRHYVLLVVLLLTGCDKDPPPPAPVEEPLGSEVLIQAPALAEPVAPEPAVTIVKTETAEAAPEPQAEVLSVPVDLSLPQELLDGLHLDEPVSEEQTQSLLPPLFVEKPVPERRLQFSGRLLLNEDIDDEQRPSVGGAELQLEFKR